jgi:hypothetical protein
MSMLLDKSSHLLEIVAHLPESTSVKHEKISRVNLTSPYDWYTLHLTFNSKNQ